MSDVLKSFRAYLITKTAVTDQVSTRIYPEFLPQTAARPAVLLSVVSDRKHHHMGGASQLAQCRVQADVFADSRTEAQAAAEGLRDAADGYRGTAGDDYFETCHLESQATDVDPPLDGSQMPRLYRVSQDWIIGVRESTPTL